MVVSRVACKLRNGLNTLNVTLPSRTEALTLEAWRYDTRRRQAAEAPDDGPRKGAVRTRRLRKTCLPQRTPADYHHHDPPLAAAARRRRCHRGRFLLARAGTARRRCDPPARLSHPDGADILRLRTSAGFEPACGYSLRLCRSSNKSCLTCWKYA